MKKLLLLIIGVITFLCFVSCTEQTRTKNFGGDMKVELPKGEKLLMATWKDNNSLFYLTEPMDADYTPKTKTFRESSSWGIVEGKVLFIESR